MLLRILSALLILAIFPAGVLAEADIPAAYETDDRGAPLPTSAPARVVCLYGSYAEAWAQAGGSLAGVTDDAIEERGMALGDDVQVIGTTKEPNLELIIALEPDLVIASADIANQLTALETLEAAGIPCAAFRVDTYRDYERIMRVFTGWTGNCAALDEIVAPMVAQIEHTMAEAAAQEAPTVLLLRAFSTGAKAKGADNLAGAMLLDLGCDNIADRHPSLLEELTLESIVAENPDHILISIMGSNEEAALAALDETLGQNPAWQALDAVRQGRVHVLPKALFHYKPNSRWGEAYSYLYELLFEE